MVDVNFIITCFNREAYWPHLKALIDSYKEITPHIAFCYNGSDKKFPCNVRYINRGLQIGDGQMICGGFNHLKGNGVNRWIKLSVDSWLCKEKVIHDLFALMTNCGYHYCGNVWKKNPGAFSTDVIFADTYFMDTFAKNYAPGKKFILEKYCNDVANWVGKWYIIPERIGHTDDDGHRDSCPALGWTMSHDLKKNLEFLNNAK